MVFLIIKVAINAINGLVYEYKGIASSIRYLLISINWFIVFSEYNNNNSRSLMLFKCVNCS